MNEADPNSGVMEGYTDVDLAIPQTAELSEADEEYIQNLIDKALK